MNTHNPFFIVFIFWCWTNFWLFFLIYQFIYSINEFCYYFFLGVFLIICFWWFDKVLRKDKEYLIKNFCHYPINPKLYKQEKPAK